MKQINNFYALMEAYSHTCKHGGGTFTRDGELIVLDDGYMVGITGLISGLDEVSFAILFDRLTEYTKPSETSDAYIGTWLNDNQVYIDISVHVDDLDDALDLGVTHDQIAIFDNKNKVSITI